MLGQSLGSALAFVGYFLLDHYKLMGMAGFMRLWGVIFVVVTVIVGVFKKEEPTTHVLPLREAYLQMMQVRSVAIVSIWPFTGVTMSWDVGLRNLLPHLQGLRFHTKPPKNPTTGTLRCGRLHHRSEDAGSRSCLHTASNHKRSVQACPKTTWPSWGCC